MSRESELLERYFEMTKDRKKALDMLEKALEEKERNMLKGFILAGLGISLMVNFSILISVRGVSWTFLLGNLLGGLLVSLGVYYAAKPIRIKEVR